MSQDQSNRQINKSKKVSDIQLSSKSVWQFDYPFPYSKLWNSYFVGMHKFRHQINQIREGAVKNHSSN